MGTTIKVGNYCLDEAFSDPASLEYRFYETMRKRGQTLNQFDTLVGTGMSGSLVVPILARAAGKDFLITRKPGDSHHHGNAIAEGNWNTSGKWLFVDDGIGTGTTYRRTREDVNKLAQQYGTPDLFHGAYLYGHGGMHGADFWTPDDIERNGVGFNTRFGDWRVDNDPTRPVVDNGPGNWHFR